MIQRRFLLGAVLAGALVLGGGPPAIADDPRVDCANAHEQAQVLRRDGHLRAARKQLVFCASDMCPVLVKADCGPWLHDATEEQPSVVIAAQDENGADVLNARVLIDDEIMADQLDGGLIEVDPGEHSLRVVLPEGRTVEQRVLVVYREKARVIRLSFGHAPAPASQSTAGTTQAQAPTRGARLTLPAILVGGLGVAALGSWAYFGLSGRSRQSSLESGCAPNCPPSDIDDVRRRYIAADISLGVSAIALGVATWLVLSAGDEPSQRGAAAWGITASPSGVAIVGGGRF